ncbi:MAG: signal peptide peptidase SppA [Verrucomicrobiia bacterium]
MSESKVKRFGCFGFLLITTLIVSGLLNFILLLALGVSASGEMSVFDGRLPSFDERVVDLPEGAEKTKPGPPTEKIAYIQLQGLISSSRAGEVGDSMVDDLRIALRQATRDKDVKAILLAIDSPGGEVTASDQIYHEIRTARERKPVVVWMGSLAASGGFYAACGGSHLIANETTFTGSIGVIISSINVESLLGKIGVSPVVFKSGEFKDLLSATRPITEEEKQLIQGLVMQTYERFLGIVAEERKLDRQVLRTRAADGRVLSGKDALAEGLIDQVGQFDDAIAKARELGKAPSAPLVQYRARLRLGSLLRVLGEAASRNGKMEVTIQPSLLNQLEPGRLYYLPAVLGGL